MPRLNKRASYHALLLPAFVIYMAIIIFPIFMSLGLSFTEWKRFKMTGFNGLDNYIQILSDPVFARSLWNNVQIMLISVFGQIPLGLLLAYLLHRKWVKGTKFFEFMIFLPITISSVVIALLWNRVFSPVGIYTTFVRMISGNPDYVVRIFESEKFAMLPVLVVLLWQHTSLYMVIFLANLQRIPNSVFEAAVIDGAKESTIIFKIVLPAMSTVIFTSSVLAISGSLKSFDLVYAMTAGGPVNYTYVMALYLYQHTFTFHNYGKGSAVSIIIVLLSVGLISLVRGIYGKAQKKYE
ncbi:MAG: carbohydrate ABC transporter permease [Sphaerochaeta sp.]|jgi:multiple sugar transport system permease protein/raffinose/stachyose/melibiose transport system permease protein|uniref:carbohydrate ABC transporter permease n=1 Tax=Sphaerochaeta sp. TaxID=1972642 RepID=UPI002FCC8AC4